MSARICKTSQRFFVTGDVRRDLRIRDNNDLVSQMDEEPNEIAQVLGPVGMAGMYSSRGEVKAAKAIGVPFTLSTMGCATCTRSRKTAAFPLGSSSICSKTAAW